MRGVLKIFMCLLVAQITVGCTQYRTDYIMPETSDEKACVQTCIHNKWVCNGDCTPNYENCMQSHGFGKRLALAAVTGVDIASSQCNSNKKDCIENCHSLYNHCFQACGGRIHTYKAE